MSRAYRAVKRISPGFLWRPIRRAIHDIAMEAGYRRDAEGPPCDLRGLITDPMVAIRRANGATALVEIPLAKCRTLHALAFPAHPESDNPYILTARWMRTTPPDELLPERSPLAAYFEAVQPRSAAELFDVRSNCLSGLAPIAAEWPWHGVSGRLVSRRRFGTMADEALVNGFDLTWRHGWQHAGPVSQDKLRLELRRTAKLVLSIGQKGYQADVPGLSKGLDQIRGLLLVNEEGKWRYLPDGGEHRVAVLAALGHVAFPGVVRPDAVYYRAHADRWPGVVAGDLHAEAARQLFDRVFSGRQPGSVESTWQPVAKRLRQALGKRPAPAPLDASSPVDPGAL